MVRAASFIVASTITKVSEVLVPRGDTDKDEEKEGVTIAAELSLTS